MYSSIPTTQSRNMHSNYHPYSHSCWNGKPTENYEDYTPFTPCLTPNTSSDDSSSISSPMISERNFTIKREPLPQSPLGPTNTSHGLSGFDIKREYWSPRLQPTMSFSSQGNSPSSYYPSSRSPSYSDYTYDSAKLGDSHNSPPKKSRKVSVEARESSTSRYQNPSYHDQGRVLSIPSAKQGDMHYDSSQAQAYSRGGYSSGRSSASRSSKGKATMDQSQSQPRKYRFVSVQSADTHHGYGASGSGPRDNTKVYLEEHLEDDPDDDGPFEHGPSEYPPRPYAGGEYAASPLRPRKATGKIPASNLDFLPVLEARFDRLENAIQKYVEYRGQQALENSRLPHESYSQSTSRHRK